MTPLEYTVTAYVAAIALLWGYAGVLYVRLRGYGKTTEGTEDNEGTTHR